jgi:cellobiose-specific phosphotransferase system component IIC
MGLTYIIVNNVQEYFVVLLVFVATVINQWMLIESVHTMVQSAAGKPTEDSSSSIMMFLVKTLMLLVVLSFGVHFIGKRIIIPLLNYVIQIFILYFSFRQKDCEQ